LGKPSMRLLSVLLWKLGIGLYKHSYLHRMLLQRLFLKNMVLEKLA